MGIFDKLKEPVFLKETSSAAEQIRALQALVDLVEESDKKQIEREIKLMTYGLKGEEQIAFELKNSHMPMYILHDLYFEEEGLSAQIDYMIITRKCIFVLECKNLIGDITINQDGDFIRKMTWAGKTVREGIYSPITQNKRHLDIIKAMVLKEKKNFIAKTIFERYFYDVYQSIVVLANPKTILKASYAPKEIKRQVIRADQLIAYIKEVNKTIDIGTSSDKDMESIAQYFLSKHRQKETDYKSKYHIKEKDEPQKVEEVQISNQQEVLIKQLKAYRLEESRKEKIKPYFIFNDKQMMELIEKHPTSLEELMQVSGFGEVKCKKYGEAILDILQQR